MGGKKQVPLSHVSKEAPIPLYLQRFKDRITFQMHISVGVWGGCPLGEKVSKPA